MADKYVMVFHDWPEATGALTAQEKGRLIDAIVCYARGDEDWQNRIAGNERFLFPMFQAQIDRSNATREAASQAHRASGKLGGRPIKTKENQNNQNGFFENQNNQNGFSETKKTHNKEEYKEEEEDKDNNHHDDDARARVDSLPVYASGNLQHMSPGNIEELQGFAEILPDDVIRFAIDEACANGAPRWAYVSAILRGYVTDGIKTVGDAKAAKDKRQKTGKTGLDRNPGNNPALGYAQRDYTAEEYGDSFYYDPTKEYGGDGT